LQVVELRTVASRFTKTLHRTTSAPGRDRLLETNVSLQAHLKQKKGKAKGCTTQCADAFRTVMAESRHGSCFGPVDGSVHGSRKASSSDARLHLLDDALRVTSLRLASPRIHGCRGHLLRLSSIRAMCCGLWTTLRREGSRLRVTACRKDCGTLFTVRGWPGQCSKESDQLEPVGIHPRAQRSTGCSRVVGRQRTTSMHTWTGC